MKYIKDFKMFFGLIMLLLGLNALAVTSVDKYEDDNSQNNAGVLWVVQPGSKTDSLPDKIKEDIPQIHSIHNAADEDWVTFEVVADEWYEIQATPTESTSSLDLRLELYNEASNLVEEKDFYLAGEPEILNYFADQTGSLFLRVVAMDYQDTAQSQEYSLYVWEPNLAPHVAEIYGQVFDGDLSRPLARAHIMSPQPRDTQSRNDGYYYTTHLPGTFNFTAKTPDGSRSVSKTLVIEAYDDISENFIIPSAEPTVPCGDVNSDNRVDIQDALAIARYVVGLSYNIDSTAADVNRDGSVTINDALMIARQSVGLATPNSCW